MPKPIESSRRYVPGLDGLRAIAVICVIAYHVGLPGARGGMLGVGVFFTLSGYLITDLLLDHWKRHRNLGLANFWVRRARRLLPALFVVLIAVAVWVAVMDASQLSQVRRQVISAALYVGNWSTIAHNGSYFARFAAPLPLDHLWSLAIEEQFYLIWPWLLLGGIYMFRTRRRLAIATLCLAVVSAWLMGHFFQPGLDPTRAYEGTDTRAFGLLIGAAMAMVWGGRRAGRSKSFMAHRLDVLGVVGLIAIIVLVCTTNSFTAFLYPYGFVLLSLGTAAVVAAVVCPASALGRALGCRPLRWIGVRSYGIYLWQWPIIVLAAPNQTGFHWTTAVPSVAGAVLAASLSWKYIEDPIRQGALRELWQRAQRAQKSGRARARALALPAVGLGAILALAIVGVSGGLPVASSGTATAAGGSLLTAIPATGGSTTTATARTGATTSGTTTTSSAARTGATTLPATPTPLASLPTRSSCRSVVYIGDSTSEGEISTNYIPNPRQRLQAQLAKVGVTTTYSEISGARSIFETWHGFPNGASVAQAHVASGFHGCWILALGTNDVANVHDGSTVGYIDRINKVMKIIGTQPVLWVSVVTLLQSTGYSEDGMQRWNHDLLAACARYPNMRILDWPYWAKRRWFIPDGIHYYTPGYIARAHRISQGLAHAFPEGQSPSSSCLVR